MKPGKLLLAVVLFVVGSLSAFCQADDPDIEFGFKPFGSYHGGDLDTVNLSNGLLNLHIPLLDYPQRGAIHYAPFVQYMNRGWSVVPNCSKQTGICQPRWVWNGQGVSLNTASPDTFGASQQPLSKGSTVMVYRAGTYDGAQHLMAGNVAGGKETLDGTAMWYDGTASPNTGTARNSHGLIANASGLNDTNGNFFSISSSGHLIDTVGRSIPVTIDSVVTDFSGCTGPLPITTAQMFFYPGYAGTIRQLKVCRVTMSLQTNWQTTGWFNDQEYPVAEAHFPDASMIQSIVLYNGSNWSTSLAWTFEYNSRSPGDSPSINYGELTKITLPTGGSLSYTWQNLNNFCGVSTCNGRVSTRTVDANDGTGGHTWKYNGATVTDPDLNDTVHIFTALIGEAIYETETDYYQGSAQSGQLLKTVKTDYQWMANPFDTLTQAPVRTATNVFPIRTTTIWPNGKTSKVEKDYDNFFTFIVPEAGQFTGSYGEVMETREYGYGDNGIAGPLVRRTVNVYKAFDGTPQAASFFAANMLDRLASVTTYDGAGNKIAQVNYGYDEFPLQPSGVATQHDPAPPITVRGNRTSESHWLNTTNTFITANTSYYDTGEAYQVTDPGGHVTTYTYGSGFQSSVDFAGSLLTQTQDALLHTSYLDYDLNTGLQIAAKDSNGIVINSAYDAFDRLTQKNITGGPSVSWTFTDSQPPSFTVSSTVTSTINHTAEGDMDGLGRAIHTKLTSDPLGNDTVDTTYDGAGRVSTVSNPHRDASNSTDGITTSVYDALSRVTKVIHQDGSVTTTDYSQYPVVTVTDPAGNQRRSRTDALGRLVEVDEPAPHTVPAQPAVAPTSGAGTITIAGTEQSQQVQVAPPVPSRSTITISGSEKRGQTKDCGLGDSCPMWDEGYVYLIISGFPEIDSDFSQGTTLATVVQNLATAINQTPGLTATVLGSQITFHVTSGANPAYMTGYSNAITISSFTPSPTAGTMTGGVPAQLGPSYDTGTVSVVVNGTPYSASIGQTSTAASIASALAASMNGPLLNASSALCSPVTPTCGAKINISAVAQGASTNYSLSASASSTLHSFSATSSGAALSDGADALPAVPAQTTWTDWASTLYFYDGLGNLACVEQHGDATTGTGCSASPASDATSPWRVRRFTYDSFSRLLTAHNPESGTITYSYDADGNLLQKTSPAPNQTGAATQTVSYCYDALHRVTGKGYGTQSCPLVTPVVTYTYDVGANAKGKLTSLSDQAGTASYTYDTLGRLAAETRTLAGAGGASISKSLSYEYNLDGSLAKLHYPSGAVVTYTPDSAGRTVSAIDSDNHINYATSASYGPDGSIAGFISGYSLTFAGISNAYTYNNRLQPVTMSASAPGQTIYSIGYDFHAGTGAAGSGADNGNVFAIYNYRDRDRDQSFIYDPLNRVVSAQNAGTDCSAATVNGKTKYWGNSYSYDAWGNLLNKSITKCGAENFGVTADAHNWIHATGAPDYQYDAAGNMTYDATAHLNYSFDQENRTSGSNGYTYTYDADGNRVRKSNGTLASSGTLYWYMTPGIVAESDLSGTLASEYMFFDGERVARKDFSGGTTSVSYYFSDHLKTASVITDAGGTVKAESDYYPWGGELQFVNNDSNHYKFTGKERDAETGLDYFGARYYSNGLGRWVSADWSPTPIPVPYADLGDPRTLNLYLYVRNNPISLADIDGHQNDDPNAERLHPINCSIAPLRCEQTRKQEARPQNGIFFSAVIKTAANTVIDITNFGNDIACFFGNCKSEDTHHFELLPPSNPQEAQAMQQLSILLFFLPGGEEEGVAKEVTQVHHLLPRQFAEIFERAGLDIEKYTIKLNPELHIRKPNGVHTIEGGNWNKVWKDFLANPENHTAERILDQLNIMMQEFRQFKGPS